jgi:hypothetical protein
MKYEVKKIHNTIVEDYGEGSIFQPGKNALYSHF